MLCASSRSIAAALSFVSPYLKVEVADVARWSHEERGLIRVRCAVSSSLLQDGRICAELRGVIVILRSEKEREGKGESEEQSSWFIQFLSLRHRASLLDSFIRRPNLSRAWSLETPWNRCSRLVLIGTARAS